MTSTVPQGAEGYAASRQRVGSILEQVGELLADLCGEVSVERFKISVQGNRQLLHFPQSR